MAQTEAHPAIQYDYDPIGRMESLTDQENATTSFAYDDRGQSQINQIREEFATPIAP